MVDEPPLRLSLSEIDAGAAGLTSDRRADYQLGVFNLPDWFDVDLDPNSDEYHDQQLRLWEQISGRHDYSQREHESVPEIASSDAIYRPAFYQPGDSELAGEHLIALGHLIYRSGLSRGDAALEYGAGYGQIALALARLGVRVHTVDISAAFCAAIDQLAERYQVDLTPHHEVFGYAPPGERFDLIYFYESFHHCLEFRELIPKLAGMLTPDGRVILAGEPILPDGSPIVPCSWGIRMQIENIVVVRERGWMELGFQQSYLAEQFIHAGFVWQNYQCPPSRQAGLWVLSRRPDSLGLATHLLTPAEAATWHAAEPTGRWTTDRSVLYLDESAKTIEIQMFNYHPVPRFVTVASQITTTIEIAASRGSCLRIPQGSGRLTIECEPLEPAGEDPRELGIFVESVTYL